MSDEKPLVYLVLGAIGSGRREVVADLIASGLDAADTPVVLTAESEGGTDETTWRWNDDGEIESAWPATARVGFFIADGRGNPVDQVEAFKTWIAGVGVELARVICVVHCRLLHANPPLLHWYNACIHFTDIVLLNQRDGVENKWMSDYQLSFGKRHLPCLVDLVKKGRVKNPALVLDLQARRWSHWFDEEDEDDWKSYVSDPDTIMIDEDDVGATEQDEEQEEDEYLTRHLGGGRKKIIPDIRDYLGEV